MAERDNAPILPASSLFAIFSHLLKRPTTPYSNRCPVATLCAAACVSRAWRDAASDPRLWRSLVLSSPPRDAARPWLTDSRLAQLVRRSDGGLHTLDITGCAWPAVTAAGVAAALAGLEGKLSRLFLDGVVLTPAGGEAARPGGGSATGGGEEEGSGGDDDEAEAAAGSYAEEGGDDAAEEAAVVAGEEELEEQPEDDVDDDGADDNSDDEASDGAAALLAEAAVDSLRAFLRPGSADAAAGVFESSAELFDNRFTSTFNVPRDDDNVEERFLPCEGRGFTGSAVGAPGDCGRLASNVVCDHCGVALCLACSLFFQGAGEARAQIFSAGVICRGCGCSICKRILAEGMRRTVTPGGRASVAAAKAAAAALEGRVAPPYVAASLQRAATACAGAPPNLAKAASLSYVQAEAAAMQTFLSDWTRWTSGSSTAAPAASPAAGGGKPPNVWRMVAARPEVCEFCDLNLCGLCTGLFRKGPSCSCTGCRRGPMCARCACGHLTFCGGAGCERAYCRDCAQKDGGDGSEATPLAVCAGCDAGLCDLCFEGAAGGGGADGEEGRAAVCCECEGRFCAGCVESLPGGSCGGGCGGFLCIYCADALRAAAATGGEEEEVAQEDAVRCTGCAAAAEQG